MNSQDEIKETPANVAEAVEKYKSIGRAVKADDATAVDILLTWFCGEEVETKLEKQSVNELLWHAAGIAGRETFEAIIKHGGEVDFAQYDPRGPAPSHDRLVAEQSVSNRALVAGNIPVVQWLIENKHLAVDTTLENGNSILQIALQSTNLELAQWLFEQGADLNHVNLYGKCALHHAAEELNMPAMVFLLQRGADGGIEDMGQRLALEAIPEDAVNVIEKFGKFSTDEVFTMLESYRANAQDFAIPIELLNGVRAMFQKEFGRPLPEPEQPQRISMRM